MSINDIRNETCRRCDLHRDCNTVCNLGVEPPVGSLMVVGDYPSLQDDEAGSVMHSNKESLFWTVAKEVVRANLDYVYFTYACKCKPREGQKPSEQELLTCASSYLRKEIFRLKPKAILLLGAMPMKAFGYNGVVGKMRGQVLTIGFDSKKEGRFETKVVITQSPGYVQYNSHELKNFALDINKAWGISVGANVDKELPTKVTLITTIPEVEQLIEYVKQTKECTFDFETTKLTELGTFDPDFKATLLAISFQHGSAYTIPLFHFDSPFTKKEVMYILDRISQEIWTNPDIRKMNQNIKFDMHVAARYGFSIFRGRLDCTMIMHSLVDDLSKHGIKEWLPTYFPQFLGWELDVKGNDWDKIPLKQLSDYAGIDADAAFRGCTVLEQKLLEDDRSYQLYRNLSMFALKPLFHAELRGMLIGRGEITTYEARAVELMGEQKKKLNTYPQVISFISVQSQLVKKEKIDELRAKAATAKGANIDKYNKRIRNIKLGIEVIYKGINFGSPAQIGQLLYTEDGFNFKAPFDRKKKERVFKTGSDEVKSLGDKTGFVQDLLIYRSIQTTWSKYLKGIRLLMDEHDRVHTTYNQARVKTGRLSSGGKNAGPNLQNITTHVKIKHPFVEEVVGLAKKAFIVPDGYTLLNIDFSQAELRMIAELANETNMINAYKNNIDMHKNTAAAILGMVLAKFLKLPPEEMAAWRQKGKAANFGLIYMQSPEGFQVYAKTAYGVNITLAEATKIYDAFFEEYPRIAEYHSLYIAKCKKYGYVRTLFGRRGHYPDVKSFDDFLRGNAERELVNMPVQGSNGENTVFVLSLLEHRLPKSVLIANTVHDSIMLYCPHHLVPYTVKVCVDTCINPPQLRFFGKEMTKLKMAADVQYSLTNWKSLKDYKEDEWRGAVNQLK